MTGRFVHLQLAFALTVAPGLPCQSIAATTLETQLGREDVYYLRTAKAGIVARPVEERAAILLRITSVKRDGRELLYELRYLGTRPGEHDLRDYLTWTDESELRLDPILVNIVGSLAEDHDGRLALAPLVRRPFVWPYRQCLQIGFWLWLTAAFSWLLWRYITRHSPAKEAPPPQASLAEQLHPLIEAALAGQLDAAGQAYLERILLGRWQRELSLEGLSFAEALQRMRAHPTAGELLRTLETWLHRRPSSEQVDVASLLAPYRGPNVFRDEALVVGAAS